MACDSPRSIKYNPPMNDGKGGLIYFFPGDCGKCLKCLTKRKAQWSYRLTEEKRVAFSSYFITLTYNDKNLPWGEEVPSINKNDHFEFIKHLKILEGENALSSRTLVSWEELERRRAHISEEGKLRYYGISEYGDQFGRPHWHYLLFNVRDINNIRLAWSERMQDENGDTIYGDLKGKVDIDPDVNVNNIDYVLKYMVKQQNSEDYENKTKECSFFSKGLGITAADAEFVDHIQKPESNQVVNQRGAKIPLPRYFRKKFLSDSVRKAKNQYIAEEVKIQQKIRDEAFIKNGHNPDKILRDSVENRHNILKSRSKRPLE